jgi:hypothetical protein
MHDSFLLETLNYSLLLRGLVRGFFSASLADCRIPFIFASSLQLLLTSATSQNGILTVATVFSLETRLGQLAEEVQGLQIKGRG